MRAYLDKHMVFSSLGRECSFNTLLSLEIKRELHAHANHIWSDCVRVICGQRSAVAMVSVPKNGHIYSESIEWNSATTSSSLEPAVRSLVISVSRFRSFAVRKSHHWSNNNKKKDEIRKNAKCDESAPIWAPFVRRRKISFSHNAKEKIKNFEK